jgi:hypothetical protein
VEAAGDLLSQELLAAQGAATLMVPVAVLALSAVEQG